MLKIYSTHLLFSFKINLFRYHNIYEIISNIIKIIICNYVSIFTEINVEILMTIWAINFEIVFRQNYKDMANHHLSAIITKFLFIYDAIIVQCLIMCLSGYIEYQIVQ